MSDSWPKNTAFVLRDWIFPWMDSWIKTKWSEDTNILGERLGLIWVTNFYDFYATFERTEDVVPNKYLELLCEKEIPVRTTWMKKIRWKIYPDIGLATREALIAALKGKWQLPEQAQSWIYIGRAISVLAYECSDHSEAITCWKRAIVALAIGKAMTRFESPEMKRDAERALQKCLKSYSRKNQPMS